MIWYITFLELLELTSLFYICASDDEKHFIESKVKNGSQTLGYKLLNL